MDNEKKALKAWSARCSCSPPSAPSSSCPPAPPLPLFGDGIGLHCHCSTWSRKQYWKTILKWGLPRKYLGPYLPVGSRAGTVLTVLIPKRRIIGCKNINFLPLWVVHRAVVVFFLHFCSEWPGLLSPSPSGCLHDNMRIWRNFCLLTNFHLFLGPAMTSSFLIFSSLANVPKH